VDWPTPIGDYLLKRQKEDGLSDREVFMELSGKNVAECVRIVLGVDDLQAAYDADELKVRALLLDVIEIGDLSDILLDDDMYWRTLTKKPASEINYDGKPIPEVVKERCNFTLVYPHLPCLSVADMQGEKGTFSLSLCEKR
jgi:hypothetical protein